MVSSYSAVVLYFGGGVVIVVDDLARRGYEHEKKRMIMNKCLKLAMSSSDQILIGKLLDVEKLLGGLGVYRE